MFTRFFSPRGPEDYGPVEFASLASWLAFVAAMASLAFPGLTGAAVLSLPLGFLAFAAEDKARSDRVSFASAAAKTLITVAAAL